MELETLNYRQRIKPALIRMKLETDKLLLLDWNPKQDFQTKLETSPRPVKCPAPTRKLGVKEP